MANVCTAVKFCSFLYIHTVLCSAVDATAFLHLHFISSWSIEKQLLPSLTDVQQFDVRWYKSISNCSNNSIASSIVPFVGWFRKSFAGVKGYRTHHQRSFFQHMRKERSKPVKQKNATRCV